MFNSNIPQFVYEQIEAIAKQKEFTSYSIIQNTDSKHGQGFVAAIISVTITGAIQQQKHKLNLICKLLSANAARRKMFRFESAFKREVYMFNTVLPYLEKFQRDRGLTETNGFFHFPCCYYASSNDETDEHIIIMEDLRSTGFQVWNSLQDVEFEQVNLLMQTLGRFHAISFAIRDQRPEVFKKFKEMNDILIEVMETSPHMQYLTNAAYDRNIKLFSSGPIHDHLIRSKDTWVSQYYKYLDTNAAEPFAVINHGDCWINNMMFKNVVVRFVTSK